MSASDEPRLAELLGALSLTTDLAAGYAYESALRASVIATALGRAVGLDDASLSDVYYTALLRGLGATAYAHEAAGRRGSTLTWRLMHPHELDARATAYASLATQLGGRLGMREGVVTALGQLHERWDGKGHPQHLRGDALALAARFAHVAWETVTQLELGGPTAAAAHIGSERGHAFDPEVADALVREAGTILPPLVASSAWEPYLAAEPGTPRTVAPAAVHEIAHAFACYVDLKSPYTLGHSTGVSHLAEAAARIAGLSPQEQARLRLAGLVHDLGSAALPNGIWDKPGPLTPTEWRRVREHATHTERILARSPWLAPLAAVAAADHERADGSGYPHGAAAGAVDRPARLLAVADAYVAMTQPRAWRPAHAPEEVARLCGDEARRGRLAPVAVEAVLAAAAHRQRLRNYGEPRAGLTAREIDVLTRLGRGRSKREIAAELALTTNAARDEVARVIEKTGAASRAAAAAFVVLHDLV